MPSMTILQIRNILEQLKGSKSLIERSIEESNQLLEEKRRDLQRHEEAREIIREVGMKTQKKLQYHIGDVTSLALEAVFDNPYELVAKFIQRRNKTECDLVFERDGDRMDPMDASGGGVVNIASFALRVASWSMQNPRSNSTLVLDEPFSNLSPDLHSRASAMLREISEKLELQLIMVTHADELVECADRVFKTTIKNGITTIKEK